MTPSAKVIEYSISPAKVPLLTVQIKAHRFVLAEINTHRVISKNYGSSRAKPVSRMLHQVRSDPAMPVRWLKNKPGMQATEPMSMEEERAARDIWRQSARQAADTAEDLMRIGLHKQWANRPLEAYLPVDGILTSTHWANLYALRRHPDAQPEFRDLADAIYEAHQAAALRQLVPGEWHLPYIDDDDWTQAAKTWSYEYIDEMLTKISGARCARVSINNFEDKRSSFDEDLALYTKLVGAAPIHASPTEHQATPDVLLRVEQRVTRGGKVKPRPIWQEPELHGNLTGWVQSRKLIEDECIEDDWMAFTGVAA